MKVKVIGFERKRSKSCSINEYINLGLYPEGEYFKRLVLLIKSTRILRKCKLFKERAYILYAYNFDILILVFLSKILNGSNDYKVIYEVADIQSISTRKSYFGKLIRLIEKNIINYFVNSIIITSQGYYDGYFKKMGIQQSKFKIWENKVFPVPDIAFGVRKPLIKKPKKWVISYAGNIRCKKSLDILSGLANQGLIKLKIHGKPNFNFFSQSFWDSLFSNENIIYCGRYTYPNQLKYVYLKSHFCWSAELLENKERNMWPVANRVYESGLFKTPQISLNKDNYTSRKLIKNGWGIVFEYPYFDNIVDRLTSMSVDDYNLIIDSYEQNEISMFAGSGDAKFIIDSLR